MRDKDGRLAGWGLPRDHFENDISNFLESQPEEIPEVKYPQSYQATFGGTPRTVHTNGEGVVFVYFNHGAKLLKESRSIQLMLIWSYQQRKELSFHLRNPLLFHLRDRLSSRY
jgi:hypothetical protein